LHRDSGGVIGLTTAASIWATASIAAAAGLGLEAPAIIATLFAVVILAWLRRVERKHNALVPPTGDDHPGGFATRDERGLGPELIFSGEHQHIDVLDAPRADSHLDLT